jgi:hypothetical protein
MLAIFSSLLMGMFVFPRSGFFVAAISVACGYAAFVAYAWVRSGIPMNDPIAVLAVAAGRPTAAMRIERFFASILVPAIIAYVTCRILS